MYFAKNIKHLRQTKGFSQEYIAEKMGYKSFTTVQKWESGGSEPPIGILYKLAKLFGVSVEGLYAHDIENFGDDMLRDSLTREQREYVEKYFALYLEGRERVHAIINFEFAKQQGEKKAVTGITQSSNIIEFPQETVVLLEPSLPVCAGMGNYLDDNIEWEERTVLKNKYTYGADYIVKLQGDSMEPEFHDGDRLIVTDARGQCPINGRVGIFIINGDAFFRQPLADVLHPYNPNYKDIVPTESDDVKYVGYVVGIIDDSWIISNKHEAV